MKKTKFRKQIHRVFILYLSVFTSVFVANGNKTVQEPIHIDLKVSDTELIKILEIMTKDMGCPILYNHEQIKTDKKITIDVKRMPVDKILSIILKDTELNWEFIDGLYVIKNGNKQYKVKTVSGIVLNEKGQPVSGVTVKIKNTTKGTLSDAEGRFSLNIKYDKSVVLVFSFIGKEQKEIPLNDKDDFIQVVLKEKIEDLSEVVITGYANVNKNSFTGNYTSISDRDLAKVSNRSIISAIQSFDPSFRIRENKEWGSDPNAIPEFYIRGNSSIGIGDLERSSISKSQLKNNPNLPLFIMDGFEVAIEKVYDFDINRIKNITILKDAAATALYGSRAANGVVIITTVAPRPGELRFSYTLTGDITAPDLSDYNLMNAKEKLEAEVLGGWYDDQGPLELNETYNGKLNNIKRGIDTYWLSQPLRTAVNHKHSLYMEGGTDALRFGVDLGYSSNEGVMKKSFRNNNSIGLSVDYRIFNFQIRNYTSYNKMSSQESPYGSFSQYTRKLPYDEMRNEFGNYLSHTQGWHNQTNTENPLWEADLKSYDKSAYYEISNNTNVNWNIYPNLILRTEISFTRKESRGTAFIDPKSRIFDQKGEFHNNLNNRGQLDKTQESSRYMNFNAILQYNLILGKNIFNLSGGLNMVSRKHDNHRERYTGFPNGELSNPIYANRIEKKPDFYEKTTRLFGGFTSMNYSLNDIYLADASLRLDGSSEFGTNKRMAPFGSIGAGINIHNYELFRKQNIVDHLKLRGSHGVLGKGDFPPYSAATTYFPYDDDWYSTGYGAIIKYLGNPNLKWEKTVSTDYGLEIGLLKNRIFFKTAFYRKKTIDLITDVKIPTHSGFNFYKDNIGEILNKGYEFNIRVGIINNRNLQCILWGNIAHNKNSILKVSDDILNYNKKIQEYLKNQYDTDKEAGRSITQYVPGGSTTSIFAMKSLGIDPSTGKELYIKKDGSVTYEWEASEQVIAGNKEPKHQGSFGLNLNYRRFSVYATFMYRIGGQVYNSTLANQVENVDFLRYNADKRVLSMRWKKPGDIAVLKDIKDFKLTTRATSRFVQDYNYLALNSVNIGYEFDNKLIKHIGLNSLKLNLYLKDIARWSTVKEERGLNYPYSRTYSFSLITTF